MPGKVYNRFKILLAEKETREGRKIPYRTVRDETGVSTSTLVRWANNEVESYGQDLISIFCEYFECEVGNLIVYERK